MLYLKILLQGKKIFKHAPNSDYFNDIYYQDTSEDRIDNENRGLRNNNITPEDKKLKSKTKSTPRDDKENEDYYQLIKDYNEVVDEK